MVIAARSIVLLLVLLLVLVLVLVLRHGAHRRFLQPIGHLQDKTVASGGEKVYPCEHSQTKSGYQALISMKGVPGINH